jgi:hypothetical protein
MAYELPPPPSNAQAGSFAWYDWYTKLRDYVLNLAVTHNTLDGLQGGTTSQYYHLTSTQHTTVNSYYSNTLTSDTSLTTTGNARWVAVDESTASTKYRIEATIAMGSALSTTGFQVKIAAPTGSTVAVNYDFTPDVVSTSATYHKRTTTNDSYVDFSTTNMTSCSSGVLRVAAYVTTSSTTGDILLWIKQSAEVATALNVRAGSVITSSITLVNQ